VGLVRRLFNYGLGIHLIEGTPEPRSTELKADADHLSFQVGAVHSTARP